MGWYTKGGKGARGGEEKDPNKKPSNKRSMFDPKGGEKKAAGVRPKKTRQNKRGGKRQGTTQQGKDGVNRGLLRERQYYVHRKGPSLESPLQRRGAQGGRAKKGKCGRPSKKQ